jgi:hypothetical protein
MHECRRFDVGYDPFVSLADAQEYIDEFYARAEHLRAFLYGIFHKPPMQTSIACLVTEIDVKLNDLKSFSLPIADLLDSVMTEDELCIEMLRRYATNLVSFLTKVSNIKSPPFVYLPADLRLDIECEPDNVITYSELKSIPSFENSRESKDVEWLYRLLYFDLRKEKFCEVASVEVSRVYQVLPGFLSMRMVERLSKKSSNGSNHPVDVMEQTRIAMIWRQSIYHIDECGRSTSSEEFEENQTYVIDDLANLKNQLESVKLAAKAECVFAIVQVASDAIKIADATTIGIRNSKFEGNPIRAESLSAYFRMMDIDSLVKWEEHKNQNGVPKSRPDRASEKETRAEALAALVSGSLAGLVQAAVSVPSVDRANEAMQSFMNADRTYDEWIADEWVAYLKVTKQTVLDTDAWKGRMARRAENRNKRKVK